MTLTPSERARFAQWCMDEASEQNAEAERLGATAASSLMVETVRRRAMALRMVAEKLKEAADA